MLPSSFPPAVPCSGAPFPPRGPSGWFPRFRGTMRRSDSLPPLPPRFVSFARRYPSHVLVFAPLGCRTSPPRGQGLCYPGRPLRLLVTGGGRASQVPGEPRCAHAPLLDPGGIVVQDPLKHARYGLPRRQRRRLPHYVFSRLDHAACALPVYASQPGSPRDHATLSSGCGSALPGGIGYPLGSLVRFRSGTYGPISSSSPRLSLAPVLRHKPPVLRCPAPSQPSSP